MKYESITITSNPGCIDAGDRLLITTPRPRWWRLIALWRWWRDPARTKGVEVVSYDPITATITVRS